MQLAIITAFAQPALPKGKMHGRVLDSLTQHPLSLVTVSFTLKDKRVKNITTDNNGSFHADGLANGTYRLKFSLVGYADKIITAVLSDQENSIELPAVLLDAAGTTLGGVTVTSRKALIQDKGDKIVYNAEKDITNAGGTAVDVLQKAPGITVDPAGTVEMQGSSNIKVLINGKPSAILAKNLAEALKMIPANIIKSVEIMTNPSAKYDAEGAGGVINIITKKQLKGMNGNVELTGGNMEQGISVNYGLTQHKFSLNFSGHYGQELDKGNSERQRTGLTNGVPNGLLLQANEYNNRQKSWYGELSAGYEIDSLRSLNFSINQWGEFQPRKTSVYSRYQDSLMALKEEYRQYIDYKNPFGNTEFNLGYTNKFKRPEQELSFLAQYSRMYDNYHYTTEQFSMQDKLTDKELNDNKSHNSELTVQVDYIQPLNKPGTSTLETGVKMINRTVASDYNVQGSSATDPGELVPDPTRSNVFDYTQRVYAAYASFKINTKNDWMFMAGGRFEHTYMDGNFKSTGSAFERQFDNFIPSVIVSKKLDKRNTLKVAYTERIARPQVWDLNPYVDASNPKDISTGNPDLQPELSRRAEISHTLTLGNNTTLNSSVYGRRIANAIRGVTVLQSDGVAFSHPENVATSERVGFTFNLSTDLTKKWTFSANGELYYTKMKSERLNIMNDGWKYMTGINTSYKLPKDLTLQAYVKYSSGFIWFQGSNDGWYFYSVAARKEFMDKKLSLTIATVNPFNKYIYQVSREASTDYRSYNQYNYWAQSFKITLNWKFGRIGEKEDKEVKKVVNDDSSGK